MLSLSFFCIEIWPVNFMFSCSIFWRSQSKHYKWVESINLFILSVKSYWLLVQVNGGKHDEERLKKKKTLYTVTPKRPLLCNMVFLPQDWLQDLIIGVSFASTAMYQMEKTLSWKEKKRHIYSGLTFHTEKLQKSKLNSSGQ